MSYQAWVGFLSHKYLFIYEASKMPRKRKQRSAHQQCHVGTVKYANNKEAASVGVISGSSTSNIDWGKDSLLYEH